MRWEGHLEKQKRKVLALLKTSGIDLSESEIMRKMSINRHTAHKYVSQLLKEKRIEMSRMVGRAAFYKIKR